MKIVIVGAGRVGYAIAEQLLTEGHDITVVEGDPERAAYISSTLDVIVVEGRANVDQLRIANVADADLLIAATTSDETNLISCMVGRKLGATHTIARVRDEEYYQDVVLLQDELGLSLSINPERTSAKEISRTLRFPAATKVEPFANGLVELVEFKLREGSKLDGLRLNDFRSRYSEGILICAVEREGSVIIPGGDFVIEPGDRVHVAADVVTITEYFRFLGKNSLRVKDVMILGGGRIGYYLAKMIAPMGVHVSLIEINEKKANRLSEALPDVNVIYGDGTDQELLEQEGLTQMDAFIALCDRDEENLMTGLFAARQGVPKVVVKNNRVAYADIISSMGLDSIVSPKSITCAHILRYVRARVNGGGTKIEKLYRLMDGKAEALEFVARPNDSYIGVPLRELHKRPNTLVAVIVRAGRVIVPFGNDHIEAGDNVVIIACESGIGDLNEVIRK